MPEEIFKGFEQLHVVVVGDVMLDNYRWGEVERISPEAPVPVVSIRNAESRLGGAANVAFNCRSLGAKVSLASVIGNDSEADEMLRLLHLQDINTDLIIKSHSRITTTKTRIISRNQQMLRFDTEISDDLETKDEHAFIDAVLRFLQIQKPDVLIFEDYNKGVLKENVISKILGHCKALRIITAVDPKEKNFFAYQGVDIFKPNLKEVREGLHIPLSHIDLPAMQAVHQKLSERLSHQISFITLSEFGVFYQQGNDSAIIPSQRRSIADVSGAGDTVIAVAALTYVITRDVRRMAQWSNIAGGLVCEEVGVVPVNRSKLLAEVRRLAS